MTRKTVKTMLWTIAGLMLSLAVLLVVLSGLSGQIFITDAHGITEAADDVMDSIQNGDWEQLNALLAADEELILQTGEDGTVERLIWTAYQDSLQWCCADSYEIQGSNVTQKITVTCLDIAELSEKMMVILPQLLEHSEREQALMAAAEQALESEPPVMQKEITMTFVRNNGQWKVVSNSALLALLSGFTGS